ncbi:alanine racemase [Salinicola lusitanus]|uniref:Alanine racemase n=1 Tax=Salinicola lusitanus TaxID=1949085 RepID=A0ABZ3CWV3_9GAMM
MPDHPTTLDGLLTPEVIVRRDILNATIDRMERRLADAGVAHRPHIKTHKSADIALRQQQAGARGITTSSIGEAEVMADHGLKDILIAYPIIGERNRRRLVALAPRLDRLIVSINSLEALENVAAAAAEAGRVIELYLEIDVGIHRGELPPDERVLAVARRAVDLASVRISGLQGYAGQCYAPASREARIAVAREALETLKSVRTLLAEAGIVVDTLSIGSSMEALMIEALPGATEVRAGNYVLGDRGILDVGEVTPAQCAQRVLTTVIAQQEPGYAILDAGSKTLTSDGTKHGEGHGHVVSMPDATITHLNEEHGFLRYDPSLHRLAIGDRLEIIPNHCCVVPNLKDRLVLCEGDDIVGEITVHARGICY